MIFPNASLGHFAGPYGRHVRQLFYAVLPWETSYSQLDDVPSFIDEAIPWFILLLLLEAFYCWKKGIKDAYQLNDAFTSISSGFVQIMFTKVALRTIEISLYVWVYEHYRFYSMSWDSPWTWMTAFLVIDFSYYWMHRGVHEINVLWSFHQIHHSSEYYNLSTALRQEVFQQYVAMLFYLPQALFLPPPAHVSHEVLNRLYQFWIHTPVIGKLGPLEWIINTPSHHRVHHGRNRYCIDKNYGGTLIIWDRIFGTFQPELEDKPVVYGLTENINSYDTLRIQVHHLRNVWEKLISVQGMGNKVKALIYGPGWLPGTGRLGDPADIPEIVYPVKKYNTGVARWISVYVFLQGAICLLMYQLFATRMEVLPWTISVQFAAVMIGSIYVLSALMEKKPWSPYVEIGRCLAIWYYLSPLIIPSVIILESLKVVVATCALFWITISLTKRNVQRSGTTVGRSSLDSATRSRTDRSYTLLKKSDEKD